MEFKLQANEEREHFLWRVYTLGYMTGELSKEQCGEICQRELNEPYDESAFRKVIQGFHKVWESVKHEYLIESDDEMLERLAQIEEKEDELYKKKVRTSDKLREYRQLLRDDARIDNLLDCVRLGSEKIPSHTYNGITKLELGSNSAILDISDWHIGKMFKNYINEYNLEIAKERIDRLATETVKYCKTMGVGELYVANLGDMIEGNLRVTARVTQEEDVIEQVKKAYQLIKYLIEIFIKHGFNIHYLSTLDNHARVTPNWRDHIQKENFGKLIDFFLIENMSDKIDFMSNLVDDNIGTLELDGKLHVFVHGHLKVHSLSSVLKNLTTVLGRRPDYIHVGHWHKEGSTSEGFSKIYTNGTPVGVDDFGFESGFFSKASQSLIVQENGNNIKFEIVLN